MAIGQARLLDEAAMNAWTVGFLTGLTVVPLLLLVSIAIYVLMMRGE